MEKEIRMSMPAAAPRSGLFASLRSRVVAIAVVPSLVFICAVVGVGWWASESALQQRSAAQLVGEGVDATVAFTKAVMEERRVSVQGGDLSSARTASNTAAAQARSFVGRMPAAVPPGIRESFARLGSSVDALSRARRDVDSGARDKAAYGAYEPVVEPLTAVIGTRTAPSPDLDVVSGLGAAGGLLTVAEGIRGADIRVAADGERGLDVSAYREVTAEAGGIGQAMQAAVAALPGARQDAGMALLDSPQWRTFTADTELVLAAGPRALAPAGQAADGPRGDRAVADDRATAVAGELSAAGDAVAAKATDIAFGTAHDAVTLAVDRANTALNVVVGVVLGVVALVVIAMLAAMRVGNRIGRRMAGLRAATHGAAQRLPELLGRIRRGEQVDVDAAFPGVVRGADEIGEIEAAVEVAQRSAVAAAAEEARTRAGANAVFLNIAHRSQAIVHRQLQVLDEAERAENDSDQLARLFQLDHLSTRERRNAENLIIMGGQQPRRRWRKPVPLAEIIRSAVSESEQYTRITLGETPHRHVDGAAVGDLIHLLAELVDNATSFSPPQCPIDITASVVGRGVAVEIEDRGLGIEPEPRARLNEMLSEPPDFGLLTLSEDSRLGLFVVSRLAQRHGVRVTLLESTYGGVQALVLVPNALLVATPSDDEPEDAEPDAEPEGPPPGALDGRNGAGPYGAGTNGRPSGADPAGLGSNGHGANGRVAEPEALPRQRGSSTGRTWPPGATKATTPSAPAAGRMPALPERVPGGAAAVPGGPADATAADGDTGTNGRRGTTRPAADATADATAVDVTAVDVPAVDVPAGDAALDGGVADPAAGIAADAAPVEVVADDAASSGLGAATTAVPPLPERRPQGHLAKGLRGRPATDQDGGGVPRAAADEPAAGRSSSAMSAMQRGVRNSRDSASNAAEEGGRT